MNEADYNLLNDYLNDVFCFLSVNEPFLINNIRNIMSLNSFFRTHINFKKIENKTTQNNLTIFDVYNIIYNAIKYLNKEYLDKYDKLIDSGIFDFGLPLPSLNNDEVNKEEYYKKETERENRDLYDALKRSMFSLNKFCAIELARNYNYEDCVQLMHEFIHYTNEEKNCSVNKIVLSEYFSIYFELLIQDCLIEENVDISEVDVFSRHNSLINISNNFTAYELIFSAYKNFGYIKEDTYKDINEYLNIKVSKEQFEKECLNLLKFLNKVKTNYDKNNIYDKEEYRKYISAPFIDDYKYFFGTILAIYSLENSEVQDVIWLNDNINTEYVSNMNFNDVLRMVNIDFRDNNIFENLVKSYNNYFDRLLEIKNQKKKIYTK